MNGRRVAWLASAVLLLCSGLATAWATSLWWLPCRGVVLAGTILSPLQNEIPGECLVRMDQGLPYEVRIAEAPVLMYDLAALALLAGALAWLVLVIGLPWRRAERGWLLALAGALGLAALCARLPELADRFSLATALLVVDVAILIAVSVLAQRALRGDRVMRRVWIPLLAVCALGVVGRVLDFAVMTGWSQLNWDIPPGTGYLGAAVLLLAAIVMAPMAARATSTRSVAGEERRQQAAPEVGSLPT